MTNENISASNEPQKPVTPSPTPQQNQTQPPKAPNDKPAEQQK